MISDTCGNCTLDNCSIIDATSSSSSGTLDDSSPSSDVPTDEAPFLVDRLIPFNSAFRGDGE